VRDAIFVHPGSGSARKNWPRDNWLSVIKKLPPPVALIVGEAEQRIWDEQTLAGCDALVLRSPPLETLVTLFSAARLFLGHDSGVSHLAAACGARCVLLFGPTEPARWAPPVPTVRVLRHGSDLAAVSAGDVQAAVAAALSDRR
jgi:heptosyltransferase-2